MAKNEVLVCTLKHQAVRTDGRPHGYGQPNREPIPLKRELINPGASVNVIDARASRRSI